MLATTALALAGCYSPSYTSCAITCATSNTCPSGLDCVAGVCVGAGDSCGGSDDASDATRPDSGLGPWGAPTQLVFPTLPLTVSVDDPTLRADMLEMFFNVAGTDIYRSTRLTIAAPWGDPTLVTELDTNTNIGSPDISADGLQLVFSEDNAANPELEITTRNATSGINGVFTTPPTVLTAVNSPVSDGSPAFSQNTLTLVFHSNRDGDDDLYISTRPGLSPTTSLWSDPVPLTTLNDVSNDDSPYLSADGLTIYFASIRNGAQLRDLYMATRDDTSLDFTNVVPISELNTPRSDSDPWVSPDGHHMYFARDDMDGTVSIWYSTR